MKTNRIQKKICDFIIDKVTWWSDSNDIDSPSLYGDLETSCDELDSIEGWISESQARELETHLTNLLVCIRNIKEQ